MAFIEIKGLYKTFGNVAAVNRIKLEVKQGELLTLLGPSGCGKTTTLRCIAGLEKPEDGDIIIDGVSMLKNGFVQPSKRGIGMVFQNYAVWPHMKVLTNIAYGLKLMKLPGREIRQRAAAVLELVGLSGLENRYPAQLSGGQQQRVALARALVRNPKVLLLDEPLSNLDAKLREELRFEIKDLVMRMGITSVYVTHDQAEAMVISDRIAVMQSGDVIQVGPPHMIYEKPANRFVADFIGTMNFINGKIVEIDRGGSSAVVSTDFCGRLLCRTNEFVRAGAGDKVFASIRPEDVEVLPENPGEDQNVFRGVIANSAYLGNLLFYFIRLQETLLRVQASHTNRHEDGQAVYLRLNPEKCIILA